MKKEKIVILLPSMLSAPAGGFQVAFEYANRLASDGYRVTVVYSAMRKGTDLKLRDYIKAIEPYFRYLLKGSPSWFRFHPSIRHVPVFALTEKFVPKADIYVATARETSEALARFGKVGGERKFYFIQGYESWNTTEEALFATWKYDMTKIVISPWLQEQLKKQGVDSVLVENGLDSVFRVQVPVNEKKRYQIIMLYHRMALKGTEEGLRVMNALKERYPDLRLVLFGVYGEPEGLPEWVSYHQRPSREELCRLYNESSVYLGTSHSEGMGLTLCEAMQCGCAAVCTDIGGYRIVAEREETALMSEPGDLAQMERNICRVLDDDSLRKRLAENGNRAVQRFTWERAYLQFKKALRLE